MWIRGDDGEGINLAKVQRLYADGKEVWAEHFWGFDAEGNDDGDETRIATCADEVSAKSLVSELLVRLGAMDIEELM